MTCISYLYYALYIIRFKKMCLITYNLLFIQPLSRSHGFIICEPLNKRFDTLMMQAHLARLANSSTVNIPDRIIQKVTRRNGTNQSGDRCRTSIH